MIGMISKEEGIVAIVHSNDTELRYNFRQNYLKLEVIRFLEE